jgi:hypothetical protein
MNPGVVALIVLGGIALVSFIAYAVYRNHKRLQELKQFCLGKGWQFVDRDSSYVNRWKGYPFEQGRNRRANAVITGSYGTGGTERAFVAFDYSFVTDDHSSSSSSTSSSTTHNFAVCALQLPAQFPRLQVTPENVLTRIGNAITGNDIELESEEFNRRFKVTCPIVKFACDVLPPRTMETMLARKSLSFRIEGNDLICWESGQNTVMKLLERLSGLTTFVDGIPAFVWKDYGPDLGVESAR